MTLVKIIPKQTTFLNQNKKTVINTITHNKKVMPIIKEQKNEIKTISTNKKVYIIGGGTSVSNFNLKQIKNADIICVNKSIEYVNYCDYFITMDYTVFNKIDLNSLKKAKNKYFVVGLCSDIVFKNGFYTDIKHNIVYEKIKDFDKIIKCNKPIDDNTGFGLNYENFCSGINSGYCALQLAIILNYDEIYLIGFDLKIDNLKTHFHNGYKQNIKKFETNLEKYKEYFINSLIKLPLEIKEKIYSCSKISSLNDYIKYIDLNMEKSKFVVIGYYTLNTPYEKEKDKLVESCKKFNLQTYIIGIQNLGSWQLNTQYKAKFIRECLDKFEGQNLIYVDCDAEFKSYPIIFDTLNYDIAVRWENFRWCKNECLSGTIFIKSNNITKKLCDNWINKNKLYADVIEQKNLGYTIEEMRKENLKDYNLPESYCYIFDHTKKQYPLSISIIEHYQASRRFKNVVKK